ncbi:MAG: purine-nucleoside phosphorylase [Acidobacteriaceae bacterium]|nr:purine-nucleoside phosphorylase [Acidobacteriaceae bacterium]
MQEAARYIESLTSTRPPTGVVLGSGLGAFADALENAIHVPYSKIPGMPASTAVGHAGKLVVGSLRAPGGTADVAVMSGRFHLYEGYSAHEVASGIRLFHELGIGKIVLTNAAGGINLKFAEGALVLISDHINLQGANPLLGANDDRLGPRFPDMTEAYSPELRKMARNAAQKLGITLHEGVYAAVLGPSYETPAEISYLKTIGADLVGMSTVMETIAANYMGIEVLGISCVTNLAAGLSGKKLVHDEVLEIGRRVSDTFLRLLGELLPRLAQSS